MEMHCVNCKRNSVGRTKQNRLNNFSNCVVCGKKKMWIIKNQTYSRLKLH